MDLPLLKRLKTDAHYRTKAFLLLSVIINFAYSIYLFVVSRAYNSKWFFIMSIYYGLLSTARAFMFFWQRPTPTRRKKILSMVVCGIFLLLINLVVTVMIFLLIYTTNYASHHEITVITIATYTFASLAFAIIGTVKHIKNDDHLYLSIKAISLISACVSLVTLTNMMLITFGNGETTLRSIILPILSVFVSIFIIACAILMIIKASKDIRTIKNGQK